ncbi:MAG: glycerophosphodiester phosphodiesterase family protein [Burkholderiales bacterium]
MNMFRRATPFILATAVYGTFKAFDNKEDNKGLLSYTATSKSPPLLKTNSCIEDIDLERSDHKFCIPHHIGESNWPANTIYALEHSLKHGFRLNNITLILTSDNKPVAFHGFDLSKFTNGTGNPEKNTLDELKELDAAYTFNKDAGYPLRGKEIRIPQLNEILSILPPDGKLIVDLKSKSNRKLAEAVIKEINGLSDPDYYWERIIFYSTDPETLVNLKILQPKAHIFLDRQTTLQLLMNKTITSEIEEKLKSVLWIGFENDREFEVCEKFTLGQNCVKEVRTGLWSQELIKKIKKINPAINIIIFGINTQQGYERSKQLGATKVYTNDPLGSCRKPMHKRNSLIIRA